MAPMPIGAAVGVHRLHDEAAEAAATMIGLGVDVVDEGDPPARIARPRRPRNHRHPAAG